MKLHGNARTCAKSRRLLVDRLERGWALTEAAEVAGVSERTAAKWLMRWRGEDEAGLLDRSSAPGTIHTAARRSRQGNRSAARAAEEIAEVAGHSALDGLQVVEADRVAQAKPPNHTGSLDHKAPTTRLAEFE
jgi:hypothetical protein